MEDAVFKSLFSLAELILANSAKRTLKILGKILPFRARSDSVIGIAYCFVVFITAYIAYVFHFCNLLFCFYFTPLLYPLFVNISVIWSHFPFVILHNFLLDKSLSIIDIGGNI